MRTLVILIAVTFAAVGQRHKIEEVNSEKPEGKLLQQIMQENDPAKKGTLLDQFATQFPKDPGTPWVLEQLQGIYVKANDADKILATGDQLLSLDPDDPEAAVQCLKAAETKKDVPLIKKYSAATSAAARRMAAAPQPKDADEVTAWKGEVDYAKQVDTYADYSLYRVALESRDPKVVIEFAGLLRERSPKSDYAAKVVQPLFIAYLQSGDTAKAIALAETVLAADQSNEEMLLVVAESYLLQKKAPEKVHAYSAKIVELMAQKPKPEGVSDADWTIRKNLVTGNAHYLNGKQYGNETSFVKADVALRAALPLVDASKKPEVLFLLGFANFKLEKPQEAANYYRDCAAIKSPYQATAAKNLLGLKNQYHGIK
jgi:tetratricopeptide (TPR) repeat protein